jgi:hypothetical protein
MYIHDSTVILYVATGILSLHFSVTAEHPRLSNRHACTDTCIVYNPLVAAMLAYSS